MFVLTIIIPAIASCLAPAVQPVYPRAPGHRPVTNLRKALEKWNAVCYWPADLLGLFTGPREKKYAVVVLFWGDWVCAN